MTSARTIVPMNNPHVVVVYCYLVVLIVLAVPVRVIVIAVVIRPPQLPSLIMEQATTR